MLTLKKDMIILQSGMTQPYFYLVVEVNNQKNIATVISWDSRKLDFYFGDDWFSNVFRQATEKEFDNYIKEIKLRSIIL